MMILNRIYIVVVALIVGFPCVANTKSSLGERVFVSVQRIQSSVAGQALAQASARIAAGDIGLGPLIRARQDYADALEKKTKRIAVLADGKGIDAEANLKAAEAEIAELREKIDNIDAQVVANFPSFLELTAPKPMSIKEVQDLLESDEALLLSYVDFTYTYIWAITKDNFDWNQTVIEKDALQEQVKLLRQDLSGEGSLRSGKSLKKKDISQSSRPFNQAISRKIYSEIFAPLEGVFGNSKHVMMVLNGPLTSLPPAVLIADTQENGDLDDLREIPWLIKRHALTTLPSVSALRALRGGTQKNTFKAKKATFVGFGDPVLGYRLKEGDATKAEDEALITTRSAYQNVLEVAQLAPLPNTSKELRRLAATMGQEQSSIYLAEQATEAVVKSTDLASANVIAFATHGLLANGLPGLKEPALVFTPPNSPTPNDDALLTASEAARLKLSADLVILSACDTAGSDGTPGAEGLSGLARAFIYAGARSILVSHWPVDDYAASVLTTGMLDRMYSEDARGRAEALQASVLDLMQDKSNARFAHPSIWAPFVVVGEGGPIAGR